MTDLNKLIADLNAANEKAEDARRRCCERALETVREIDRLYAAQHKQRGYTHDLPSTRWLDSSTRIDAAEWTRTVTDLCMLTASKRQIDTIAQVHLHIVAAIRVDTQDLHNLAAELDRMHTR